MFKTELEIELEKALEEINIYFFETKKEQIEKFLEADFKKYPWLDPENRFNNLEDSFDLERNSEDYSEEPDTSFDLKYNPEDDSNEEADDPFEYLDPTAKEYALNIFNAFKELEKCKDDDERRKMRNAISYMSPSGKIIYKIKSTTVNDFYMEYKAETELIDNPAQAYSEGNIEEFLGVTKRDKNNKMIFYMSMYKKQKEETCHFRIMPYTKKIIESEKLQYFQEYHRQARKSENAKLRINELDIEKRLAAWNESEKLLPKFPVKEFVIKLMELIGA